MKLLVLDDYRAVPSDEALMVKAFRALIERDPSEEKERACAELAFVWFVSDWESTLVQHVPDEDTLWEEARDEIFGEGTDWEPDDLVSDAVATYKKLNEHPVVGVLKAGYQALGKYRMYLESIDFTDKDERNTLVHDPKKVMDTLNNLGKTVSSLDDIEEKVRQKQQGDGSIRGGFRPNEFSA